MCTWFYAISKRGTNFTENGISEAETMARFIFVYADLVYYYLDEDTFIGYMFFFYDKNPSFSKLKIGAYRFAEAFRDTCYSASTPKKDNYCCILSQHNGLSDSVYLSPLQNEKHSIFYRKIEAFLVSVFA